MGVRRKGLEEGGERVDEGDELAKDAWRRVAGGAGVVQDYRMMGDER